MTQFSGKFDAVFLNEFKQATEAAWEKYLVTDSLTGERIEPHPWQKGTKWLNGASESDILKMESIWGVKFPDDYRLFLKTLFTTNKPLEVEKYSSSSDEPTLVNVPSFYNYLTDKKEIEEKLDWLWQGIVFDVENNNFWLKSWGPKPSDAEARATRVQELVKKAPRLIPIFSHRYLLIDPCQSGNPVFSIHQSDIIVYGEDLRIYLLNEFRKLLGLTETPLSANSDNRIRAIPFWGELYFRNMQ